MKEIIIVAGISKHYVCRLRHCLREKGYDSIPCNSAEQLIEEMEIFPDCDAMVPLTIIEPKILSNISDNLIARLSDFALDVPFLACNEQEAQAGLAELFDKICEYRNVFRPQQNPELADLLSENGVQLNYS